MTQILSLEQLLNRRSEAMEGTTAMTASAVHDQLTVLPGWQYDGEFLRAAYSFANYYETLAFVNALAYVVHAEDHHPELLVTYNRCEVKFNTHSVGGISINDFICAAKVDTLYGS